MLHSFGGGNFGRGLSLLGHIAVHHGFCGHRKTTILLTAPENGVQ